MVRRHEPEPMIVIGSAKDKPESHQGRWEETGGVGSDACVVVGNG